MSDAELLTQFRSATLDPTSFHHADHVRVAWLYVRAWPLAEALGAFSDGIRRIAAAAGKPDRYHETVTWAFLLLIHERVRRGGETSWSEFARANADLLEWPSTLLRRYYREETLQSDLARQTFVLPDRLSAV